MKYSATYRRILNRMGYYAYQNGLIYNHLQQEGGWDDHLAHCRDYIIRALDYFKPSFVTVIGSGWLLDLPLAEILEKTERVYLVDIVHPPDVVKQAGDLAKVILVEQDVTGGVIEEVYNLSRKSLFPGRLKSLGTLSIPEFDPSFDPGIIISLNIITQLESRLIDWLKKRTRVNETDLQSFRKALQQKHLSFLVKHKAILITDYAEIITKKSGEVAIKPTLIAELPMGQMREEWIWDIDLIGNENYMSSRAMKIVSMII